MRNVSDEVVEKRHFIFSNIFRKSCHLCD